MSRWTWNEAEDEALDYLPWEAQVLYLRGLRRRMDYRTGLVGATKHSRISRSWLIALLEVHRERGSHEQESRITVSKLRNLLRRLERAGLIEPVENRHRAMIFRLPLADMDRSVQMRNDRGTTEERPTMNDRGFSSCINEMKHMNDRGATDPETGMNDRIPETGNSKYYVAQHSGNTPRARVDPALIAALAKSGFRREHVHTPRVMAMLRNWQAMGVTPEDVLALVALIRERSPGKSFTPAYLEQPMQDYLEERQHETCRRAGQRAGHGRQTAADRMLDFWERTGAFAARSLDRGDLP